MKKVTLRRIWNFLRYPPQGRLHHWLLRRSWLTLLALCLACWLTLAAGFAFLYRVKGLVWDDSIEQGGAYTDSYHDLLYFSIITQATVGYGDMKPREHASRELAAIQAILGTILGTVGFALVVSKLIQRRQNILFANKVCYNKDNHQLIVWCWNKDISGLHNFHNTLGVEVISTNYDRDARTIRFMIKPAPQPTYIKPMGGIVIKSSSQDITDPSNPPRAVHGNTPNPITICSLDSKGLPLFAPDRSNDPIRMNEELPVEVRAVSEDTGEDVFARKVYQFDQIICGRTRDYGPLDDPIPENWLDRAYEHFGMIDETPRSECDKCILSERCPLRPALVARQPLK